MNLPNKLNNGAESSSDSEEETERSKGHLVDDLKRRSNQNKFQLKDINHDLVLQKYEDMMKGSE